MTSSEWRTIKLEEVAREITVGFVGSMVQEYVTDGIPFLRSQNIEPFLVNRNGLKFISPEFHKKIKKSALSPGDVIIVRTGKPGACALVPDWLEDANCSDIVIVRCGPELDARFLVYYINSAASHHVSSHTVGAVQQHFNVGAARTLKLKLPPLEEQRRIAHTLGTLDDKIELNRQLNATLERLAQTLFQSWFVDFDPVRAKASGEPTDSICRRLGLTPELLALFPAALEDSAMGEIPAGWEVKALDTIATFLNGVAAQKYPPQGKDDLPVIKIAQLRKGNTEGADIANASTVPLAYIVENGDVLFSWSGSLEVEIWGGGLGLLNQHLFKVESEQFPKWFYFTWTRHHLPSFRLTASDKATTMGHIQRKHLTQAKVVVPPAALLNKMTEHFAPLLSQTEQFSAESRTLAALRDELLPKLLAGDLRLN